jgi:Zn-dependent alcohol dehydrogenase
LSTLATANVTDGYGRFELTQVELGDPEAGEVLVELKASGVCHTDFDSLSWKRRLIMGHEGAGVVRACGDSVPNVQPGDRVRAPRQIALTMSLPRRTPPSISTST